MVKLNRFKGLWNDKQLREQNDNVRNVENGINNMNKISSKADSVLLKAQSVNKNNVDTNERLDRELATFTSDSEVIDARGNHDVLSARLNDYDYLVSRPMLNNGKIILPSDFPEIPFNIYRKDRYDYTHDATPYNQFDWSDATEIFITDRRNTNFNGLSIFNPIDPYTFNENLVSGLYGSQESFIFTFIDNLITLNHGLNPENSQIKNVLFRSAAPSGKTILGRLLRVGTETSEWLNYEGVYRTTLTESNDYPVFDVVNTRVSEWVDGIPSYYEKENSIAAVKNKKGTYYQSGRNVYCNPHVSENIKFLLLATSQRLVSIKTSNQMVMFENMMMMNENTRYNAEDIDVKVYWFNCVFPKGVTQDAFSIYGGKYSAFLLDCISAGAAKDGFNYHSTNTHSLAVEINTNSHSNGKYKPSGSQQTTHSNNGSTAHDGMNMLRVGSHYWDCEGPVVADVNDCYSISIGVKVGSILETTTGHRDAFHLSAESGTSLKPKYVIECDAYGDNIINGINAPQGNVFYMDFTGKENIVGAQQLESWGG